MSAPRRAWPSASSAAERLVGRAVEAAKDVDEVRRRLVAENELFLRRTDGAHARKELPQAILAAPRDGRCDPGGRRHVPSDDLQELSDEAFGRPVGERDLAAGSHDAHDFASGPLLIRREHDAEGRQRDVERVVVERQTLGVALDELDLEPLGAGALGGAVQQLRARSRGRSPGDQRRAAASVALPLPQATSRTRDPASRSTASHSDSPTICSVVPMTDEVARGPHGLLAGLDGGKVEGRGSLAFTDGGIDESESSASPRIRAVAKGAPPVTVRCKCSRGNGE